MKITDKQRFEIFKIVLNKTQFNVHDILTKPEVTERHIISKLELCEKIWLKCCKGNE